MENKPKVTVLVTTYNHENWIEFGINSIINQSYKNIEIRIIDDQSTDSTFQKISAFKQPIIQATKNIKNIGCARSMNSIMDGITSKYIAMTAGDDAWMSEKIEAQVDFMENHPNVDICLTDSLTLDSNHNIGPRFPYFHPENRSRDLWLKGLFFGNFIPGMSVMFRNSSWFLNNRYDPSLRQLQDWEFWIRAICDGLTFHILQSPLTLYRVLPNSLSNDSSQQKAARGRFEVIRCLKAFKRLSVGELRSVFHEHIEHDHLFSTDRSADVCLALLASKVKQTPYHQFAADTLQDYYREKSHLIDDLTYHSFIGSLSLLSVT